MVVCIWKVKQGQCEIVLLGLDHMLGTWLMEPYIAVKLADVTRA